MADKTCTRRNFLGAAGAATAAAVFGSCGMSALAEEVAEGAEATDDAPETAGDTIYIVDVLHCKPGTAREIYDLYMTDYVPGAQERGMTLEGVKVQPPIWLVDEVANNTLTFTWSVAGMMGWATMVGAARYTPGIADKVIEFWADMDARVESRERTLSAPDADVESLTTLARLGM